MEPRPLLESNDHRDRVLAVADWNVDPHAVVAALARRHGPFGPHVALLVPAWLHGLDWAGDPTASAPCAQRQLDTLQRLCAAAGLPVEAALVGDPDPATAITDALLERPAEEILLFTRRHTIATPSPFDLAHRVERATGVRVHRVPLRRKNRSSRRAKAISRIL